MGTSDNDGPRGDNTSTPPKEKKESVENEKKTQVWVPQAHDTKTAQVWGQVWWSKRPHLWLRALMPDSQISSWRQQRRSENSLEGHTSMVGTSGWLLRIWSELPVMVEPSDSPENAIRTQERIWEKQVDEFVKRSSYLTENVKTLYSLVWGQCTDIRRSRHWRNLILGQVQVMDSHYWRPLRTWHTISRAKSISPTHYMNQTGESTYAHKDGLRQPKYA